MAIQIFDASQVIDAPIQTGKNLHAHLAPGRALEGLGAAVQNAGKQLEHFALQKQRADNISQLHAADEIMMRAEMDFQAEMAREGDETKWQDLWTKKWNATSSVITQDKMAPVVRQELQARMTQFNARKQIEIGGKATVRAIQRDKAKTESAVELHLENGDLQGAVTKIKQGLAANLYSPEEAEKRIQNAEARIDHYEVNRLIQDDPRDTYGLLTEKTESGRWRNFKNLAPDTRNSLTARARREAGQARSELYSDLILRAGNNDIASVEEVNGLVETGDLEKRHAAAFLREFHSPALHKLDPRKMAAALRAIEDYNPGDDPFFETFGDLHAEIFGLPAKQSSLLLERLKQKQRGGTGSQKTADLVTKRLGSMFSANFFSGGEKAETPEAITDENIAYLEMMEQAQIIMGGNPKMSASEVMGELLNSPVAEPVIMRHSAKYRSQLGRIDPSARDQLQISRRVAFEAFQSIYPSITADMTLDEALQAAGDITEQEKRDIRRLFAIQQGEEELLPVQNPTQPIFDPVLFPGAP